MNISKNKMKDNAVSPLLIRDTELMEAVKACFHAGDSNLKPAADILYAEAEKAMGKGPFTIVNKRQLPPSGDVHDYMSVGPYWWPDPESEDGLPYIRRDGEVNPERMDFDHPILSEMAEVVETLALAGRLFNKSAFSQQAVELLKVFFLHPETRMNPHLEFGQAIPGRCEGRGIGIIETKVLAANTIDAIGLLHLSNALDMEGLSRLRSWFRTYLDWLRNSTKGADESHKKNNHGTAYDLQVAVFALFTGDDELARDILEGVSARRIFPQVEPDGRQPEELSRTRALSYSTMNLSLYFDLASVAEKLDIDLWNVESCDGRGIKRALDWLIPYWTGQAEWVYEQITDFQYEKALELLLRAALKYGVSEYSEAIERLPIQSGDKKRLRTHVYWPS